MSTHTEEEAMKLWCPEARVGAYAGGSYNREHGDSQHITSGAFCIASKCMAFRWMPDYLLDLGGGRVVILDAEDGPWAEGLGLWWDGVYPKCDAGRLHVLLYERLHGEVPEGLFVDHIDGDRLNARRGNLRAVTPMQNAANAAARGGVSRYRGVHRAASGKWVAQISKDGVRECLGTFASEIEAAAAYDEAAKRIHGEFARLNLAPRTAVGRRGYCGKAGRPTWGDA